MPVFLLAFFYACVSALTRLLYTFFLGANTRESRYTWLLLTWSLRFILLSCQRDRAFQESEHAIIRLLGDCGRIRTSLRCTIAAKPIHSHDLLSSRTSHVIKYRGNATIWKFRISHPLSLRCTLTRKCVALHSCAVSFSYKESFNTLPCKCLFLPLKRICPNIWRCLYTK